MATTAERAARRAAERGSGGEDQDEREEDGRSGGEKEREGDQDDDYQDAGDGEPEVRERAPPSLYPGSARRAHHLYQQSPGPPAPKPTQRAKRNYGPPIKTAWKKHSLETLKACYSHDPEGLVGSGWNGAC